MDQSGPVKTEEVAAEPLSTGATASASTVEEASGPAQDLEDVADVSQDAKPAGDTEDSEVSEPAAIRASEGAAEAAVDGQGPEAEQPVPDEKATGQADAVDPSQETAQPAEENSTYRGTIRLEAAQSETLTLRTLGKDFCRIFMNLTSVEGLAGSIVLTDAYTAGRSRGNLAHGCGDQEDCAGGPDSGPHPEAHCPSAPGWRCALHLPQAGPRRRARWPQG